MTRRLPPLNALRAFEAAARLMSFTKAADELNVTPAAISHQVRHLETTIGVKLFRRMGQTLELTDLGRACLPGIIDAFDRLAAAMNRLHDMDADGPLVISVEPSFAAKWLVPRIHGFHERHPDIDLDIVVDESPVDFAASSVDVAIRYGKRDFPGLHAELLLQTRAVAICSKALLDRHGSTIDPDSLGDFLLLHDDEADGDESCPDWATWLRLAGHRPPEKPRSLRFNRSSLVVDAAVAGWGIALTKDIIAAYDLECGTLVEPFAFSSPVDYSYYIVCPTSRMSHPRVKIFIRWLQENAAACRESLRGIRNDAA